MTKALFFMCGMSFNVQKSMHFIKIFNVLFLYAYYALFFNFYYFTIKTIIFSLKYVCQNYVFLCNKAFLQFLMFKNYAFY